MNLRKMYIFLVGFMVIFSTSFQKSTVAGTLQDIRDRGRLIAGVNTDFPPFGFLDEKRE